MVGAPLGSRGLQQSPGGLSLGTAPVSPTALSGASHLVLCRNQSVPRLCPLAPGKGMPSDGARDNKGCPNWTVLPSCPTPFCDPCTLQEGASLVGSVAPPAATGPPTPLHLPPVLKMPPCRPLWPSPRLTDRLYLLVISKHPLPCLLLEAILGPQSGGHFLWAPGHLCGSVTAQNSLRAGPGSAVAAPWLGPAWGRPPCVGWGGSSRPGYGKPSWDAQHRA